MFADKIRNFFKKEKFKPFNADIQKLQGTLDEKTKKEELKSQPKLDKYINSTAASMDPIGTSSGWERPIPSGSFISTKTMEVLAKEKERRKRLKECDKMFSKFNVLLDEKSRPSYTITGEL